MVALLTIHAFMTVGAALIGTSHLVGSFMGGLAVTKMKHGRIYFKKYMKIVLPILSSIFFGTLGFVIPVRDMFDIHSFLYGLLYTIPAIVGKFVCGVFAFDLKDNFFVVACAMVGRGELGFVMGVESRDNGIFTNQALAICCWALVIATFIAPFFFKLSLNHKLKQLDHHEASMQSASGSNDRSEHDVSLEV